MPAIINFKGSIYYLYILGFNRELNYLYLRRSFGDFRGIISTAVNHQKLKIMKTTVPQCKGAMLKKQKSNRARTVIQVI